MVAFQSMAKEVVMPEEFIAGNPKKGAELVADCAACHGQNGIGLSSDWPNLAGQNQKYLYEQLKYFQSGQRENVLMTTVIDYLKILSDEDIRDIAAFYADKSSNIGAAKNDEELLALGSQLYKAGDFKRGIPSCSACHSIYGQGNDQAGFPAVNGQQKGYLVSTLKAYRSGQRNAGEYSKVMQAVSMNLTDRDIEALANYMHGLYE
jgi:cytochrome c553